MNAQIRTLPGINGPVMLSAWCPVCDQQAMPDGHGHCVWCNTPIVSRELAKAWT